MKSLHNEHTYVATLARHYRTKLTATGIWFVHLDSVDRDTVRGQDSFGADFLWQTRAKMNGNKAGYVIDKHTGAVGASLAARLESIDRSTSFPSGYDRTEHLFYGMRLLLLSDGHREPIVILVQRQLTAVKLSDCLSWRSSRFKLGRTHAWLRDKQTQQPRPELVNCARQSGKMRENATYLAFPVVGVDSRQSGFLGWDSCVHCGCRMLAANSHCLSFRLTLLSELLCSRGRCHKKAVDWSSAPNPRDTLSAYDCLSSGRLCSTQALGFDWIISFSSFAHLEGESGFTKERFRVDYHMYALQQQTFPLVCRTQPPMTFLL